MKWGDVGDDWEYRAQSVLAKRKALSSYEKGLRNCGPEVLEAIARLRAEGEKIRDEYWDIWNSR